MGDRSPKSMSEIKELCIGMGASLQAFLEDPSNAEEVKKVKQMCAADASEGKMESKKAILQKMVSHRVAEKPDSRLAPYKDDVTPLLMAMMPLKDDPDCAPLYAALASLLS